MWDQEAELRGGEAEGKATEEAGQHEGRACKLPWCEQGLRE
jgi:hypothetical protein